MGTKFDCNLNSLIKMQEEIFYNGQFTDVKIILRDGYLKAHKSILAMNSKFLNDCFKYTPNTADPETVLLIPDVDMNIMQKILDFIYLGKVTVNSDELTDFFLIKTHLEINIVSFDCFINNKSDDKISDLPKQVIIEHPNETVNKLKPKENVKKKKNSKIKELPKSKNNENTVLEFVLESPEKCEENIQIVKQNKIPRVLNNIEIEGNREKVHKNISYSSVPIQLESQDEETIIELVEDTEGQTYENHDPDCFDYVLKMPDGPENDDIEFEIDFSLGVDKNSENMKKAVQAVLENNISLNKAAKLFKVSKTVLWRRLKKVPDYEKILKRTHSFNVNELCERLRKGENLVTISQILKIPVSTLHFHKKRLLDSGFLPETYPRVRNTIRKDKLQRKKLEEAIKACKNGMVQNQAAKMYGISKATLYRRLKSGNT